MSPCWPKTPRSVTPSSRAGNRDIIAKYVSVPAASVISCARKFANARLRTAKNDGRPALLSPGASCASSRLEAAATPAAGAVAAGSDAGQQDEDRRDDADDRGQAEHEAQPVHEGREQDRDEDADHLNLSFGMASMTPRNGVYRGASPPPAALIPCLRQQGMALGDRRGNLDDRAVAAAGVVAQPVERLALRHAVALHEDALRALDERPALEGGLEPLDLLDKLALLLVPAHSDLDRGLDRLGASLARVRGDAAVGSRGDEGGVLLLEDGDDRAARELADLLDEVERVGFVLVDDDDRHVRVVARDDLGRLLHADRHLGDHVAELPEKPRGDAQRALVFVGEQHFQGVDSAGVVGDGHRSRTLPRQPTLRHTVGRM